jgi:phosphoenolpyruvate phosphomutase
MLDPATALRARLDSREFTVLSGAHDAVAARIAESNGFDGVWASGLGISAAYGVPDDSILTMTEFLQAATVMAESCRIPVVADCDTGFGHTDNVRRLVQKYEQSGVAGICIEDKVFPKRNSLGDGSQQLEDADRFCEKIAAAKDQAVGDFVVIARTEALIAGAGQDEAARRGAAYEEAGADVLLVHSRSSDPAEVLEFGATWRGGVPLAAVPTTYPSVTRDALERANYVLCIYANQALRAAVRAMDEVLSELKRLPSSASLEAGLSPLSRIFELSRGK